MGTVKDSVQIVQENQAGTNSAVERWALAAMMASFLAHGATHADARAGCRDAMKLGDELKRELDELGTTGKA